MGFQPTTKIQILTSLEMPYKELLNARFLAIQAQVMWGSQS